MIAAARRIDIAIVAEIQGVRVVAIVAARRCRPIRAAVTDNAEMAVKVVATTRSRVPDG